jgi:ABC-2 type transport system ATP-binding protein
VILSTHILPEVEQTCHRVIIIDHGKIVAVDTPQNLRVQAQATSRTSLEVEGPAPAIVSKLKSLPGIVDVRTISESDGRARFQVDSDVRQDIRGEMARAIVTNGWGLLELHSSVMSLEDIFIKLTTAEETHTSDTDQS